MKRRVILALLLLVAGAIVNVAVAWGCVSLDVSQGAANFEADGKGEYAWYLLLHRRPGALHIQSTHAGNSLMDRSTIGWINFWDENWREELTTPDFMDLVPKWSRVWATRVPLDHYYDGGGQFEHEDARGWPTLALRSGFDFNSFELKQQYASRSDAILTDTMLVLLRSENRAVERRIPLPPGDCVRNGILINPPELKQFPREFTVLPLRPIWPGFAINTVFYAAILWLLFAAPLALRRRRRIKRGLCPKCAYDLRGSKETEKCPECGSIVPS